MATDQRSGSTTGADLRRVGDPRHSAVPVAELALRGALVIVAAAAAAFGLPTIVAAPLVLLAGVAVLERVVRYRRRGLLDAVLTGITAAITALVLLGLALNFLPWGLSTQSWAIGSGCVALLALACCLRRDDPPSLVAMMAGRARSSGRARPARYALVCMVAAGAVLAGSMVLATTSSDRIHLAPVEMSASTTASGTTEISFQAGTFAGPFDLLVVSATGTEIAAAGIVAQPNDPKVVPISALPTGHVLVQLVASGSTEPFRELIFDNGVYAGVN
jgi:hypothetical protein